jgi:pyruvate dehydrogenase E2 component (dihydrolipoamide acetyltransferase)
VIEVAIDVILPKLGLTMQEATIVRWIKKEGDPVTKGEAILEIETDKSTVEIESPVSGKLGTLLYPEGTTIPVGEVISHILISGEAPPQVGQISTPSVNLEVNTETLENSVPGAGRGVASRRIMASPVARRVARELGIDINQLRGTGPAGRVMEADVRQAVKRTAPAEPMPLPARTTEIRQPDRLRRLTAERMVQSFTTAPHFYLTVEVDAGMLVKMREGLITAIESKTGIRLTISDLLVKITAQALEEFPQVNVLWENGGIRNLPDVNIGLAVATDRGLIVPVFRQANRQSLAEITLRRQAFVEKARKGSLAPQELEGGSFTLTNLGTYAVDQFNAIINPPQAAILSAGRIKDRPVAIAGELAVRPTLILTLSVDHRILDGAEAAVFLDRVVNLIEAPYLITTLW